MTPTNDSTAATGENDLLITRVFDAPRSLVFKAWTDPAMMARWWGPRMFTNPVCEIDPRPGGAIRIHMRSPDGTVYRITGEYREIVEPERLVYTSAALDDQERPIFEVLSTVTFDEHDGRTTLTLTLRPYNVTPDAGHYLAGMEEGWSQSLDRLDALAAGIGRAEQ